MNRSLKLSMLLALGLGSAQAAALDLGQIQVRSALGQPLLAEIPLTPDSPAELRNLSARLASPEDFARAGLTGGRPDIPLQFSIATVGGQKVIRITSAVAVNDPYLDLLVEVNSAAGRSLREFPILLDPPGTAPTAPSVRAPRGGASRVASRPAAAASTATPATAGNTAAGGQYGPVERGQTLSGIARQLAPAGVDPGQMMLALKQANPEAFYQDNINALKRGAVLRVPTGQEAQAMSVAAALTEIRRQNGDWRASAARSTTTVADAATRAETSSSPSGTHAADRLALVPAKEGGKGAGVQGGSGKGDAALRQDLLRSQEQLTTLQQQSADLKSRLKDLQDINGKNTRLLALKDNEIAELQQKLADARKKAGLPAAPASSAISAVTAPAATATVAPAAAGSAIVPATTGSLAGASSVPASHSAASPAITKPAPRPAAVPVKHAPKATAPVSAGEPWYMQPLVWAAGGAAILLLILLALLGRRRKATVVPTASAPSSLADRFGALPATSSSADPDQDELLDQLAEHPDDVGLHLELVSLYYSRRDVEHFEAAAEAMHAHIADPQQDEWQDVLAMGEDLVPGHPLFAGAQGEHGYADHSEQAAHDPFAEETELPRSDEALHSFDLDSYAAHDEEAAPPPLPASSAAKVSEYHFDFDLTPPARPSHTAAVEPQEDHTAESHFASPTMEAEPAWHGEAAPAPSWNFETATDDAAGALPGDGHDAGQFSDDPIDTKLDLARAYMDMGDADGARAMLEEVLTEGSQIQRDAAQRLIDSLA
jgi:pilus assembly protein FimV